MVKYENQYHEFFHHYLIEDAEYYNLRSKLAFHRYFNNLDNGEKVLEYGVGLGQNIFNMQNRYGFDISKFALNFIQEKKFTVYFDANQIPDNFFDIVLCCHVLEHLENPAEILKLIRTKIKTDGKLILVLPKEFHQKVDYYEMSPDQHLFLWNFRTINNLLIHCGFRILKNEQYPGTGYYKLKALSKISFSLWNFSTSLLGTLLNRKELVIVAAKEN